MAAATIAGQGEAAAVEAGANNARPVPDRISCFPTDSWQEAEHVLRVECEDKWHELKKLQEQLAANDTVATARPQAAYVSVALATERHLEASIEVVRNTEAEKLPANAVIQFEVLRDGLEQSICQLQETLSLVLSQKKELQADLRRAEKAKVQLLQVHQALDGKLRTAVMPQQNNPSEGLRLRDLDDRHARMVAYCNRVVRSMNDFASKYFAVPSTEQTRHQKSKQQSSESDSSQMDYVPLQRMLEDLMNRCLDTPHDPYITLNEALWPPYVELLVKCGIARRHPQDTSRLKMVPFHM